MENLVSELQQLASAMQVNLMFTLGIIGILFAITLLNAMLGYALNIFGIYPRSIPGLLGIFTGPFVHGHFNHVFFNSIPLFVLSNFILFGGRLLFVTVSFTIIVLSGSLIWLFGRKALHIGASSVITGYLGYLFMTAFQQPAIMNIILIIVCVYYFGGMLAGLLPLEEEVSWEGHLFGFVSGFAAYLIYPDVYHWLWN